jgi:hypothetical protein
MTRRTFVHLGLASAGSAVLAAESRQPVVGLASGAQWHRLVTADDVDVQIIRFDAAQVALRVLDQPERSTARSLGAVMEEAGAIAGVNAGFFTPEFEPLGLVIGDGKRHGTWQRSTLLGGAVMVRKGKPLLLWREEVGSSDNVTQLVQAGPRLVNHGVPVQGLEASKQRARSFIATDGDGGWAIGIAAYLSLAALSQLLVMQDLVPGFTVHRALNFDGGKSTGLWLRKPDGRTQYEREFATVRNFVGIFPRS